MKKLRWYVVTDDDERLCYVIWASSHSKAKIAYWVYITWNLDTFESLSSLRCNVIKQKLSIQPEKEKEEFEKRWTWEELVKEWIYWYAIDETCPHCWECWNIYYDGRFYCWECEDNL